MAVFKLVSLFVVAVLLAATSFSCTSAFDSGPHEAALGGRKLFKSMDSTNGMKPRNTPTPPAVGPAPGLFSLKPRNTPAPPAVGPAPGLLSLKPHNTPAPLAVGPAPGLFDLKPRNTPAPPAVGPAPGLFNLKPRNTPAPPAVGPAPGTKTNGEVKTDQPASITIHNNMEGGISAHCHSSQRDVPNTVILQSGPDFAINFEDDLAANIPWICDFSVVGGTATQSFPVWTHDGTPYLSDCDECLWKVQNDGFWIWSTIQSMYINVHPWNVNA